MNRYIFLAAVVGTLVLPASAEAKGCIKGAIVGGVAGHMAGHGKLGAVAGCVIGHHEANKHKDTQSDRAPSNDRSNRQ